MHLLLHFMYAISHLHIFSYGVQRVVGEADGLELMLPVLVNIHRFPEHVDGRAG